MEVLTATLERVLYSSPSRANPGRVFAVLALRADPPVGEFRGRGEIDPAVLGPDPLGEEYRVQGEWTEHPKYGRQLALVSLAPALDRSARGVAKYLERFDGIGPATARTVVEALGEDCLDILAGDPSKADGLGLPPLRREAVLRAAGAWARASAEERVVPWLMRHGLGPARAARAVAEFGPATRERLESDPWLLADIEGFGFLTADKLAMSLGVDPRSPSRIEAAIRHVLLEAASEGHVYLPVRDLVERTVALLREASPRGAAPDGRDAESAIRRLANSGRVVVEGERGYLPQLRRAEETVAAWVLARILVPARAGR